MVGIVTIETLSNSSASSLSPSCYCICHIRVNSNSTVNIVTTLMPFTTSARVTALQPESMNNPLPDRDGLTALSFYVPVSESLTVDKTTASGVANKDYGFTIPGYKHIWFNENEQGTISSIFAIGGLKSNQLAISTY